jgi:hypothetical protein
MPRGSLAKGVVGCKPLWPEVANRRDGVAQAGPRSAFQVKRDPKCKRERVGCKSGLRRRRRAGGGQKVPAGGAGGPLDDPDHQPAVLTGQLTPPFEPEGPTGLAEVDPGNRTKR